MTFKEFIGMILSLSPLWSIGVNAYIAWITAGDRIKGKRPTKAIIFITVYAVVLLSLAFYSSSP